MDEDINLNVSKLPPEKYRRLLLWTIVALSIGLAVALWSSAHYYNELITVYQDLASCEAPARVAEAFLW